MRLSEWARTAADCIATGNVERTHALVDTWIRAYPESTRDELYGTPGLERIIEIERGGPHSWNANQSLSILTPEQRVENLLYAVRQLEAQGL